MWSYLRPYLVRNEIKELRTERLFAVVKRFDGEFHDFKARAVQCLELTAEEHGRDIRKQERLVFLDYDTLHIAYLVVAGEHVVLNV